MSDKSIRITENQIVEAMDEMCLESLDPELHEAWEKIVTSLTKVRIGLANYPKDISTRKCTDERPCVNCFSGQGECLGAYKEEREPEIFPGTIESLGKLGIRA